MKRTACVVGFLAVMIIQVGSGATAQSAAINPVGSYTVGTISEEGVPLNGTMTIRANATGYDGEFVATTGDTVKMLQVTTNGQHMMAVFEAAGGLAVTWLQRQSDGAFTGSWHQLGPGINVKVTKKTTEGR
jgi:hypothetical protein